MKHQCFEDGLASYPICEMHFDDDKILQNGKRKTLVKGSVPTIFPECVEFLSTLCCLMHGN